MNLIRERTAVALAAVMAVAALGACKKSSEYAADTSTMRADSAGGTTIPATRDTMPATPTWSDGAVLGYVLAANNGEVSLGQVGEKKATSAAVKAFARKMVTDHKAAVTDAKALGTKLSITGDATAKEANDLATHVTEEVNELTQKAAGADWDKNYMDKLVSDHEQVLGKLQDAAKSTMNPELKTALEKATGDVQRHLTKAKDIRDKLK